MRISARNALPGKIVDIKKGATTAHVRIDVNGTIVTASDHQRGCRRSRPQGRRQESRAVIKASDVMVAIPLSHRSGPRVQMRPAPSCDHIP